MGKTWSEVLVTESTKVDLCRRYPLQKIKENNEAEIMQVVLSEAQESYKEDIILVLQNDNVHQQDDNVERIVTWLNSWVATSM